jgi:hypothetical protein
MPGIDRTRLADLTRRLRTLDWGTFRKPRGTEEPATHPTVGGSATGTAYPIEALLRK